jgi:isopentenyl-diphosphate Delta-isomerase
VSAVPSISARKNQHLELARSESSQFSSTALWQDVHLVHSAVPTVGLSEVDLSVEFLGRSLAAPVVLASMTGGVDTAAEINRRLGAAAAQFGIAVGVGSQRAAIENAELAYTYTAVREKAPDVFVLANIGMSQLLEQRGKPAWGRDQVRAAIDMVGAQALVVHLNVTEELVQTEGDRSFRDFVPALRDLCTWSPVPVVAKETGSGLVAEAARVLVEAGVSAVDVGGAGGTSFSRIEGARAATVNDDRGVRLGETYADWGVPTAACVLETRGCGVPVIATGGVRTGLDAAKALALGADLVGVGAPALRAAVEGEAALMRWLELFIEEVRLAFVLTGSAEVAQLRRRPMVLSGLLREWQVQRLAT